MFNDCSVLPCSQVTAEVARIHLIFNPFEEHKMSLAKRDFEEKRNFIRMKVDTPVTIHVDSGDSQYQGICRDLSGGGLLVELPAALPVGTVAEVSIKSHHGHSPMLQARAVVTRVEAQPDTTEQPCLLGMEIEEVLKSN